MNRTQTVLAVVLALAVAGPVAAQIENLDTFQDGFQEFSDSFANSLPMNATIGLNWSDAYIGQLLAVPPNVGVGITTGVTTIPSRVFDTLIDDLNIDPSGGIDELTAFGVPVPGYAFDARVGGILLPFDVGLKFGTIPQASIGDVEAEYTNIGADIRYAILDGGVLPKLSVGVGYSYLSGRIATPLGLGNTTIGEVPDPDDPGNTITLELSDPDLEFEWEASVIDVKAQLSKRFLIIEPHVGLAASFGTATTDAGLSSSVTVNGATDPTLTADELGEIAGVDISDQGLIVSSDVSPFALRAFGGLSLNIVVLRLDLGLMYNINSGALGGTVGARVQL